MLPWHDMILIVCLFSRHNLVVRGDSAVEMVTKSRVFVTNIGSTLHFECAFKYANFNFFDNPILWRKIQLDEESQINMMGNLMEPFESSGRFRVSFGRQSKISTLELFISNVIVEDSGNYTCEVNGPHNKLLNSVTHYVFVRAAVESINLSLSASDQQVDENNFFAHHTLVFVENVPSIVSCKATGGYPPPDLTLHIDKSDVTDEFSLQHRISYSGKKSLRRLIFTSWRLKHGAVMKRNDDGRRITCVATVPGLQSNSTSAIITVHHKPSIACEKTLASLGERNVHLKCTVISKPPTHFLYWVVDSNSTRLSEGDFINGHWTQIAIRPGGGIESKLYMLQVKPESYRKYKLVAGNAIGNHSQEAALAQSFIICSDMHSLNKESDHDFTKRKMLLRDQASSEKNLHVKHDNLRVTQKSLAQGLVNDCWVLLPIILLKTL